MRSTILKASYTDLGGMAAVMNSGGAVGAGYGGPTNSQFGPGLPPQPRPIGGDPRLTQGRPGWNLPTLPGEGRLIDYTTLRQIARIDPLVKKAIAVRKDQMCNLNWDIIARDRKNAKKARQTVAQQQAAIDEVKKWMDMPDGRLSWTGWLSRCLEDHFVIDGVALYKRRNLDPDAGPVSKATQKPMGKFLWLEQLDATTIKPLRDTSQREPLPPLDAYQQFLFGIPVFGFTSEELVYAVKEKATDTPYGFSPVEMFLTLINLNLRYWSSMNAIYTDGTLPEGIVTAPEGWTPQQIQGFADNWNRALAGDPRALRKLHMAPHGVGWIAFKEHVFDKELARFLIDILALAFDLTANELGFEPKSSGLGGKGFAEGQERVQNRRGIGPTSKFLIDDILNPILWTEFGLNDLTFAVVDQEQQDEEQRAKADDIDLKNGRLSLDELVERDGGDPPGVGRLFVVGPNLVLGEADLIRLTKEGAAALGLVKPAQLDENGMPIAPPPPAAIGPDGKPMKDPETGEPLQTPTLGADGKPLQIPVPKGGQLPPDGTVPGKPAAKSSDENKALDDVKKSSDPELMLDDMRRWELKSMRSLRRGKSAAVRFESDYIPADLAERVSERLSKATTPDAVKAAFIDPSLTTAVKSAVDPQTDAITELARAAIALAARELPTPRVYVNQPEITVKSPDVHVAPAEINITTPDVKVENHIEKPDPIQVRIVPMENREPVTKSAKRTVIRERDAQGRPSVIETEEV